MTCLLDEVPQAVREGRWPRSRATIDRQTGERRQTDIWNIKLGPSLTLHEGGLLVERSLPKALRGENIHDLRGPEVAVAVGRLDGEIADLLGYGLPSVWEWKPVRVDYCESRRLGSEDEVRRDLARLAYVPLSHKGLPVRGQHHSVRWAKGLIQPKFYSKFSETKGDPLALGVLRREATTMRLRTFRDLTGQEDPRMADVLRPEVFQKVWEPFEVPLRGVLMSKDEISDLELVQELTAFFGVRRAAALVGYCVMFVLAGVRSRQDMLASPVLEHRTKYRVLADLRQFRQAMLDKGYGGFVDEGDESEVMSALGHLPVAA